MFVLVLSFLLSAYTTVGWGQGIHTHTHTSTYLQPHTIQKKVFAACSSMGELLVGIMREQNTPSPLSPYRRSRCCCLSGALLPDTTEPRPGFAWLCHFLLSFTAPYPFPFSPLYMFMCTCASFFISPLTSLFVCTPIVPLYCNHPFQELISSNSP
ncbi:MAG: hypothetical protein JOS17DRAFT_156480 [Linnemannia elongata]|nr:MAG: hypothetical protein JOS17DRAFT_156480 [Linnemannia elongata]